MLVGGDKAVRLLAHPLRQAGILDRPGERKVHIKVMPRLGGLAIYISFIASVLLIHELTGLLAGFLIGVSLIVALGVIDDFWGISPGLKLTGQLLAAGAVIPFGLKVDFLTNPFTGGLVVLGFISIPVTIIWLVAMTNAINLIDGLDGLAGGISCIAAFTIAAVSWWQWRQPGGTSSQLEAAILALILAAAIVGFLRYNFHPARIFLGDSGSMFLGFSLASISIMGVAKSTTFLSLFIPIVIFGVPILDTACAILRRYFNKQPIFQADHEHIHHRLLAVGFSHRQAVLLIYGVSIILGVSAFILAMLTTNQAVVLLVVLVILAVIGVDRLGVVGRKTRKASRESLVRRDLAK